MINSCHPERPYFARGFCKSCYYGKFGPGYESYKKYQRSKKHKDGALRRARTPDAKMRRAKRRRELRYGITDETYQRLLKQQNKACAICHQPCSTGRRLSVDHAHIAECHWKERKRRDNSCHCPIRGLLCQKCNAAICRTRKAPFSQQQLTYINQ